MKRQKAKLPTVPLEGLENLFSRMPSNSLSEKEEKEWYKIVKNFDEGDDESIEHSDDVAADEAHVYIYDEIGGWFGITASSFIKAVAKLDVKTIHLHINSPGGSVFDGVAIYNALLQHDAKIVVSVDSLAASAASFIAQAGDEIIMRRASTMMIHDAAMIAWGDAAYLRKNADILDKLSNNIASVYAARTGGSAEEWRGVMIGEAWYTASEAVEAGLADRVDGEGEDAENNWDLSAFMHAGRSRAPSPELIHQNVMLNRINKENKVAHSTNVAKAQSSESDDSTEEGVQQNGEVEGAEEATELEETPDEQAGDAESQPEGDQEDVAASSRISVMGSGGVSTSFMVNGVPESDLSRIQSHINTLEGFYNEARSGARTDFVDQLVSNGQIAAPQAESLKGVVSLDNMTDAQFENFKAAYKDAPRLPILARHGKQGGFEASNADKERADRIEVLNGIVTSHRNAGMSEEEIAKKDSYQELQILTKDQDSA